MAERSAFEKIHEDESEQNDLGGVLEQLNLPPAVVTFVRENKRLVQICIAALVLIVVAWALYDSYRDKKIEEASSALSMAADVDDNQAKIEALRAVSENYSGTTSALWAKVNTAHEMMKTDQKQDALNAYTEIHDELDSSSPLYPLVTIGVAQAHASLGNFDASAVEYENLKGIEGYDDVGYSGLARISEERGDFPKALSIYEEYLETLTNVSERNQKALVEEKIARLKAAL